MKDYYKILGVKKKASEEEIRARWAELVRKYHPDHVGIENSNDQRIKEINEAYDILKHPSTRVVYDLKMAYEWRKKRKIYIKRLVPLGLFIIPLIFSIVYFKRPQMTSFSKAIIPNQTNQINQIDKMDGIDQTNQRNEVNQIDQINQIASKKVDIVIPQEKVEIVVTPVAPASALPSAAERKLRSKEKQPAQAVSKSETPVEIAKVVPEELKQKSSKKVKKVVLQEEAEVASPIIEPSLASPVRAEGELGSKEKQSAQAVSKSETPVEIAKVPRKEVNQQASIPSLSAPGEELRSKEKPSTQTILKSEIPVTTEKVVPKETSKVVPQEMAQAIPQTNQIRPEGSPTSRPRDSIDATTPIRMDSVDTKSPINSKAQLTQQRIDPIDAKAQSTQLAHRSDGPGERISAKSLIAKEEEVKQFFATYIERYIQKDLDGFLSTFSSKAVQNQKEGFDEIRKIYANFFNQSQQIQYKLENMKIEIYQNIVEVKGNYEVDQKLKKKGEKKIWKGPIRWTLVKEQGVLKIISIDYLLQKDS
jgi:hypothetical protein